MVDDFKSFIDLEYDSLFNFFVRLFGRVGFKDDRVFKRFRGVYVREFYTFVFKKFCDFFGGCDVRFSDFDDDVVVVSSDRFVICSFLRVRVGIESKVFGKSGFRDG